MESDDDDDDDDPDNYELQQHRRSSVAVEWYEKCITTAIKCTRHKFGATDLCYAHSLFYDGDFSAYLRALLYESTHMFAM